MVRSVLMLAAIVGGVAWLWPRDAPPEVVEIEPTPAITFVAPITVEVVPPAVPEDRWGLEAAGHLTLFVETLLAEVPGVVPWIAGVAPPPGLARSLPSSATPWRLTLALEPVDDATIAVGARLCAPTGACTGLRGSGSRTSPALAATLVADIASKLGRPPTNPAPWSRPETADPYASLLLGRAAAVAVGLRPAADDADRGDVRRDPVARAVFLDPRMATAQAIVVRTSPDVTRRLQAARMAAEAQPWSLGRAADLASALSDAGLHDQAREAWVDVARRAPGDGRFVLARAWAALAVDDARAARAILAELGERGQDVGAVIAVEVAVGDALGTTDDALLTRWQQAATDDPEPVRRRIAAYVGASRLEDALALTGELGRRGRPDEANALTVAIASDLGHWDQAADAATSLGDGDVARRLAAATATPQQVVDALAAATAPEARLARAQALLEVDRAGEALRIADDVLEADPWWPEALWIASRAHGALGDAVAAEAAKKRLLRSDPLFFEEGRR